MKPPVSTQALDSATCAVSRRPAYAKAHARKAAALEALGDVRQAVDAYKDAERLSRKAGDAEYAKLYARAGARAKRPAKPSHNTADPTPEELAQGRKELAKSMGAGVPSDAPPDAPPDRRTAVNI